MYTKVRHIYLCNLSSWVSTVDTEENSICNTCQNHRIQDYRWPSTIQSVEYYGSTASSSIMNENYDMVNIFKPGQTLIESPWGLVHSGGA